MTGPSSSTQGTRHREPRLKANEAVTVPADASGDYAAEPVLKVETREELVYLLGQACEIEHGLMCEYLYAQFSLKRGLDEDLTPDQLGRVQAWETALISVIKQEMLHLALSTNILTAIGAAPHFERPNFPVLSRWYPPGVQIALVPFGERALRHFIYLERPEGMALQDAAGFAAAQHARPLTVGEAALVAVPQQWRTVGHLYRGIEAGLDYLCGRYGEDAVFIGPPRVQAVTDIFEWPELIAVTGLASARQAIEVIVEQGEGARGDWMRSHFGTFVGILEDLLAVQSADPAFNPARPVEPAFVRLPPDVDSGALIEDVLTARVADLANGLYEVVLQVLSRYYIHHGETAAELDTLARTAKHLMNWVMRELGAVLATLPVGPSRPGCTAGFTFDIARPATFLLPHRDAAWKIIRERLDTLEQTCASLSKEAGLSALAPLAGKLHSMSQDVGQRLTERTAQTATRN
ncbi:MAG TPA: ferritin-like domain-containing protein [Streptosporangiaceae bacterium]|nr:ferritin-like domain-containing protein [Streptosporangiaceae bacterium]